MDAKPGTPDIRSGLQGQVALITGGAQGIGAACASRFARDGAIVVIADVDDERGAGTAAELGARYLHCDVGDSGQVEATVASVVAAHGRIDILVNNARIFRAGNLLEVTEADFVEVLRVNLTGAFLMVQAVARHMVAAGAGSIVNVGSEDETLAIPSAASYSISKGGIRQLTRVFALALADRGVRVNAVAPGTIAAELAAASLAGNEVERQRVLTRTPMSRFGEAAQVAEVVAFLASAAQRYTTGEIIVVDGGSEVSELHGRALTTW